MGKTFKVLGISAGVIVGIVIIATATSGKPPAPATTAPLLATTAPLTASPGNPASLPTPAAPVQPAPIQASGPATTFEAGTYEVGTDVKAGKYKTAGPAQDEPSMPICYWSRKKNSTGDLGSIIANGILQGPGVLTVNRGEVLEATGTCSWKLAG